MTIEEEIENAIKNGSNPLFLYGLIEMVENGEGSRLTRLVDVIGQRLYRESEQNAKAKD